MRYFFEFHHKGNNYTKEVQPQQARDISSSIETRIAMHSFFSDLFDTTKWYKVLQIDLEATKITYLLTPCYPNEKNSKPKLPQPTNVGSESPTQEG